ncbi:MAG: hypothetical protein CMJ81_22990 [Planctomycetaceae bacterium]|nr:hypothetical protein [Planctomycetaceae bacterium]MBP60234.1 hypothetical protein [Planctomycetaceae bacterium]
MQDPARCIRYGNLVPLHFGTPFSVTCCIQQGNGMWGEADVSRTTRLVLTQEFVLGLADSGDGLSARGFLRGPATNRFPQQCVGAVFEATTQSWRERLVTSRDSLRPIPLPDGKLLQSIYLWYHLRVAFYDFSRFLPNLTRNFSHDARDSS